MRRLAFLSLFILGLSGCPSSNNGTATATATPAPADEPFIKVGQYVSLTGGTATFGQSTDRGVQLALAEINGAGGVLGKQIKVITEDTQSKPETSKTAVLKLIKQDHVVALIGEIASSRTLAAAPEAQRAKVPLITPGSTNPEVTQKGDFIFRICFIDPVQGQVMARFAAQDLKLMKAAILTDVKNDYSVGLAKYFKEEYLRLGGKVVAEESYSEGDSEFKAQLTSIKGKQPDILILPGYYTEVGMIANQSRELGMKQIMLGGDGWDSEMTAKIGGKAIEGSYYTNHYATDDPNPVVQDFIKKYKEKYQGQTPDAMAALGYDTMKLVADALKRAGTTDGDKLRQAVQDTKDFPGVTGSITIDKDRNASKPITVLKIENGEYKLAKAIAP
jgi:branched-chain amino acid transport system substrate-binding protein